MNYIKEYDFISMSLGKTISSLRKNKGMSQELLAESTNISLRTIQRIENNATTPRPYTLKTLADALGVPLEQLTALSPMSTDPDESQEAYDKLIVSNFSALAGLIVPLANIIVPLLILRGSRSAEVKSIGRKIISFQIIWSLTTMVFTFLIPVLQYSFLHAHVIGRFPPTIVIVYLTFLVVNLLFTLRTAAQLQRRDTNIYPSIPGLF
jgi:transcriptional regulator with XRE-family HTH domain